MAVNWKIRQGLVSIEDLLTAKDNVVCATIDKPSDAKVKASVQNMASPIYIDFINSTELQHLFS
jgi:hypothetical protein